MEEVPTFDSPEAETAYYEAEIAKCFDAFDRVMTEMNESQKEIDRLGAETDEILERIKACLSSMEARSSPCQAS